VGKIHDIFSGRGIRSSIPTASNIEGIEAVKMLISQGGGAQDDGRHLVFANLVDFDMLYGHRNNVEGYADALREFDAQLPEMIERLRPYDVLVVTADHGCDPTTPSTDHSREYVPLLIVGKPIKPGVMLGTRRTFADLGATLADLLNIEYGGDGRSMRSEVLADT